MFAQFALQERMLLGRFFADFQKRKHKEERYKAGRCRGRKWQRNRWEWKKREGDGEKEKGGWVNIGRERGNS